MSHPKAENVRPLYVVYKQAHDDGEDDETTLRDMLADLLHLADALEVPLHVREAMDDYEMEAGRCRHCHMNPQEILEDGWGCNQSGDGRHVIEAIAS